MNKVIQILAIAALALLLADRVVSAAERVEEATVLGEDKSGQAGAVPTDTRAAAAESKMKKEEAPTGLKSDAPGVRSQQKMEKPKMADSERKKPDQKKGWADSKWLWILLILGAAVAAG